jgi:protein TonB
MMRLVEALVFLSLAAGLHVGVWATASTDSGSDAAGDTGTASLSLQMAQPSHAAMVREWETPPTATQTAPTVTTPDATVDPVSIETTTEIAPRLSLPDIPTLPRLAALPQIETEPPRRLTMPDGIADFTRPDTPAPDQSAPRPAPPEQRPARPTPPKALSAPLVASAPIADTNLRPAPPGARPKARPAPPPRKPKVQTSNAAPATRAAGVKRQKSAVNGQSGSDATQSLSVAQRNAVRSRWGAGIQRRVHRNMAYPRGATGEASARVALTVDRSGRLMGLKVIRSSGVAAFDTAAVRAVKRAGRFSAAPKELTDASYSFTLSLTFKP